MYPFRSSSPLYFHSPPGTIPPCPLSSRALSTGRDALLRVRSGKWLVGQRLEATLFWEPSADAKTKGGTRIRPPPRRGWRGHGWDVHAWKKANGRGRDGGSTALGRRENHDFPLPTKETIPLRMDHAKAYIDGLPQYSHRRPFHLPRWLNPIANPSAAPPLSEGGECLRAHHAPNTTPIVPTPSPRSTRTGEEMVYPFQSRKTPICPMPPLTLRRCVPIAFSTALQCAHRRMPRMWGIRRCAHGEGFSRFQKAKRWETPCKLARMIYGPEWEK